MYTTEYMKPSMEILDIEAEKSVLATSSTPEFHDTETDSFD